MTATALSRPPSFANLKWCMENGGGAYAAATPDFWSYYRPAKDELRGIGISVKPERKGGWRVVFDAHRASQSDVAAGMQRVREILHEQASL